jgi:fatty-acyl-CoA synthase
VGREIYPREIEVFVWTSQNLDVQVIGIQTKYGEEVMAWVRLKEERPLRQRNTIFEGKIAHYKIPGSSNLLPNTR